MKEFLVGVVILVIGLILYASSSFGEDRSGWRWLVYWGSMPLIGSGIVLMIYGGAFVSPST